MSIRQDVLVFSTGQGGRTYACHCVYLDHHEKEEGIKKEIMTYHLEVIPHSVVMRRLAVIGGATLGWYFDLPHMYPMPASQSQET